MIQNSLHAPQPLELTDDRALVVVVVAVVVLVVVVIVAAAAAAATAVIEIAFSVRNIPSTSKTSTMSS